jgi:hypothetical protein
MSEDERHPPEPDKPAAQSGSSRDSEQSLPATIERRAIRWDAMAAIIAACIGLLSLIVAGYTAYIQHHSANVLLKQTQAQVWPYLEIGVFPFLDPGATPVAPNPSTTRQGVTFMIANRGVGPAIIRGVEVDVKGRPQPDWVHVFKALRLQDNLSGSVQGTLNGRVLAPGQNIVFLMLPGKGEWSAIRPKLTEMTLRTCYCSTLGQCWRYSTFAYSGPATQQVKACNKISRTDQFTQ